MRTILVVIFLVLYAIVSIPLYLVEFIIGKINSQAKVRSSQFIVSNAFKVIMFLSGTKVIVVGRENVPKEAVLFVANHRSYFDIVITYATTPNLTGFVAKKEIKRIPCISHWMKILNCLFLDRDDIRAGLKTILEGVENIKNGYSMYIAPEGTRNQEKEMLPFKEGSFKLAQKSGCPIVPIAISNTDEIYENHTPWIHSAKVVIHYGNPINLKDLSKEEQKHIGTYVQEIIYQMLQENEDLLDTKK